MSIGMKIALVFLFAAPAFVVPVATAAVSPLFARGHVDFLGPDGSVACSSLPSAQRPPKVAVGWMSEALQPPMFMGPLADPETGAMGILSTAPIRPGLGVVVGFVDLASLGAQIASVYRAIDVDHALHRIVRNHRRVRRMRDIRDVPEELYRLR